MKRFMLVLIILSLVLTASPSALAQEDGVSDARFARLSRGINMAFWFWLGPPEASSMANHFTEADFAIIHDLGFTHVRIPIDFSVIYDATSRDLLNAEVLAVLDDAIAQLNAADLAVIIDLHSTATDAGSSTYSAGIEGDATFVRTFIEFWASFANHLNDTDPEMVFIEPMNEPVFQNNLDSWIPIQEALVTTIRASAPDHTILATSNQWSHISALIALEPLDDPNIVYNFHFYEPFPFTHQGASWSMDAVKIMRDVPYPLTPETVSAAVERLRSDAAITMLNNYAGQQWDAAKIEATIAIAANWAAEHGVRITCNEFGVYSQYAPPEDRVLWTHDLRVALENHGIGWTMWEYDNSFGLVTNIGSLTIINGPLGEALGLNVPEDVSIETQ